MRFRTSMALVGAGALGTVLVAAAPSIAAPYPPSSCGTTGSGTVSRTQLTAGQSVVFSGGGFAPGSTEQITVDGASYGTAPANAGGTFSITITLTVPGTHTLRGIGPIGNNVSCAAGAAATSHGSVSLALATGGSRVVTAADVTGQRVVTAVVTVLPAGSTGSGSGNGTAAGTSSSSSSTGGLPFTGAETAGLVAAAVLLIVGGVVLRVGVRRRRAGF